MNLKNKIKLTFLTTTVLFFVFSFHNAYATTILWTGAVDGDLSNIANYEPQVLPTEEDTLDMSPETPVVNGPSSGISYAGVVISQDLSSSISGGTFYGDISNTSNGIISGGIFYGTVTNEYLVSGGIFNGPFIESDSGLSIVSGATFNGSVTNFYWPSGNTTISASDFNGPIIGYLSEGWGNDYSGVTDISGVTSISINGTWDGTVGRVSTSTIVENYGNITGGIFDGDVLNYGGIGDGTFYGQVILDPSYIGFGSISGGTFYGLVNNTMGGLTYGGTYLGPFSGVLYVSAGSYSGITDFSGVTNIVVEGGVWDGSIINNVTIPIRTVSDGYISGGTFSSSVTNDAEWVSGIIGGTFYTFVTNNYIIEGGSFCQSQGETGGTIYGGNFSINNPLCYNTSASITVTSPTNLSVLSSWSPSISFTGSPTTCKYKMDSDDYVTLDCNSISIPTPTNWPHLLTITAENSYGASTSTISFIYSDLLGMIPTGTFSPIVLPAPTNHTLNDIYNVIELGTPSETDDHTLSTSTSPTATTTHSTSEIYARLANLIDASTIKAGVTYLGVTGGGETPEPIDIPSTSLTPLLTPNDRTGFSLEDIYQLVKNNVRVTSSTHDITNLSSVALTQHSIEDIYRTLTALIQPGNVLINNTYLGVVGGYDPREGLIAQWKMNDTDGTTILDSIGTNNGIGSYTPDSGKVGGAATFDGTIDYIDVNTSSDLKLLNTDFTISAWVYPTAKDYLRGILSSTADQTGNGYFFRINHTGWGSTASFWYGYNGSWGTYAVDSTIPIPDNTWTNITVIHHTGADTSIYINGVLNNTTATPQPMGDYNLRFRLADEYDDGGGRRFTGGLDDVRVYDRALSQGEIDALYNSGNGTEN